MNVNSHAYVFSSNFVFIMLLMSMIIQIPTILSLLCLKLNLQLREMTNLQLQSADNSQSKNMSSTPAKMGAKIVNETVAPNGKSLGNCQK